MMVRLSSLLHLDLCVAVHLDVNATTHPSKTALPRAYADLLGPITAPQSLYVLLLCSALHCPAVALRSIAILQPAAVI